MNTSSTEGYYRGRLSPGDIVYSVLSANASPDSELVVRKGSVSSVKFNDGSLRIDPLVRFWDDPRVEQSSTKAPQRIAPQELFLPEEVAEIANLHSPLTRDNLKPIDRLLDDPQIVRGLVTELGSAVIGRMVDDWPQ